MVESLVLVGAADFKIVESSSCLADARDKGSGKAPTAEGEVELVDDKVVAVNEAFGNPGRPWHHGPRS